MVEEPGKSHEDLAECIYLLAKSVELTFLALEAAYESRFEEAKYLLREADELAAIHDSFFASLKDEQ